MTHTLNLKTLIGHLWIDRLANFLASPRAEVGHPNSTSTGGPRPWWVQVSSTVPQVLTLTVNWSANGSGIPVTGSFALVVPRPIRALELQSLRREAYRGVSNFRYRIVSN